MNKMSLQNTQNLVTDLCRDNSQSILVKQYEKNSRFIMIKCTENGKFFPVSNKCTRCNIKMLTPDNRAVYNSCEILDNGMIRVSISESMVHAPGVAHAELNILDLEETGVLATMTFDLIIKPSPYPEDRITDSEEFSALLDVIANEKKRVDAMLSLELKVADNEETRKGNENDRILTENERIHSESIRMENENARLCNEKIRQETEEVRTANEKRRTEFEQIRDTSEEIRTVNESERLINQKTK